MNSISEKIDELKIQLFLMIERYEILKKQNLELKQEVDNLTGKLKLDTISKEDTKVVFETQKVLQEKIDQCVAEINECITLIKNG
jgi:cell division septum initiation protein DivIVA